MVNVSRECVKISQFSVGLICGYSGLRFVENLTRTNASIYNSAKMFLGNPAQNEQICWFDVFLFKLNLLGFTPTLMSSLSFCSDITKTYMHA